MAQQPLLPPSGFDALPTAAKVDYVEALWERVREELAASPDPEWLVELLKERVASHRADPARARPWAEVRERLLNRR